ncbi:MAG TPA: 4Fe-4S cluster-binding domain-containing protein [Anaerohalosphaeraceae bacterium]|nr:4Fe-4S cluster-binding domain-containing protein [Phycisphaerae bacterium]HOK96531.1 4Fe-4S cluster-binding domain-containing protein [Anaerohalosphaeraceae bacterium]HOL32239.1 4Fe-4S cluster-binding domain-containing protein [Anaerohalosphaeraceae bacterium]HOM76403.1 4Fe-4S cluster-binding domain-containing protein [Anaerohalosphaeraceae bacterium]HPC63675.1 4Fe-4S cluster-binding domain-containing protein [Anaerohalosphaeraceae bacterium]
MENAVQKTIGRLKSLMNPCRLCPRQCGVCRSEGQTGFCGIGGMAVVSSAGPHFGEERVLVGSGGSGTIFFAGCNLRCLFCQNFDISHFRSGVPATSRQLAQMMLQLQDSGCVNINLVTPTHIVPPIAEAIVLAKEQGLHLPIVYNCGGYESVETLRLLEGLVDIYMPDMKFSDSAVSRQLADAADYPQRNRCAVQEMHRQTGDLCIENGLAVRGLLVRHLVLPNNLAGSMEILDFLAEQISPATAVNVMDQYRPCFQAGSHPRLNRRPSSNEIESVVRYAAAKGLTIIE